jgi:uncharacterized membrane protein
MSNYSSSDDGKLAGIISYFTIIGWLIAYFALYQKNKTYQASYQMRQTLLFHIVSMIVSYAAGAILFSVGLSFGAAILWVVRVALFIIWLIGLLGALQGERKPMPLIGEPAQNIFSGI